MKEIRDTAKEVNSMCGNCGQITHLVDGVICEACDIEMWGE